MSPNEISAAPVVLRLHAKNWCNGEQQGMSLKSRSDP
jgi:hypothetical protein